MNYLIGIDIGTSGTKTVLFDGAGNSLAGVTFEYPLYQPKQAWAEQSPEDWADAAIKGVKAVLQKTGIDAHKVAGVGLSGQMHGLVMLDKGGKVLRKSIIWCDQRTQKECDEITEKFGRKQLIKITANPALTGFTLSKILWVKNNEPEIFKACAHILLPKDYVRYVLTGVFAAEVSDASGMQLLDVPKRKWSGEICDAFGIKKSLLADVYESWEISGRISEKAAALTGLIAGTPVVGGAGDQAAAAIGSGIVKEGIASCTLGTSGVVFAHTDAPLIDKKGRVHTFCHAIPNAWHIMGVTQSCGLSLQWFRNAFCQQEIAEAGLENSYQLLDKKASEIAIGSDGVVYLPYLMGERTPHLDPDARGMFFGFSATHTRIHFLRAVLEGIAFSQLDSLNIIRELGCEPSEVRLAGGGAKSPLWKHMLSDVFGCETVLLRGGEGGALGVAVLAAVGAGLYPSVAEAAERMVKTDSRTRADMNNNAEYLKYYGVYKDLYKKVKSVYKDLAGIVG